MKEESSFIYYYDAPVLSSEVGDVELSTDKDHAEISVFRSSDSAIVYKEYLYPDANGKCTIWMLGDILTQWMTSNSMSYGQFTIFDSVADSTIIFYALKSSRVSIGLSNGFESVAKAPLLSSHSAVISSKGIFFFHFFAESSVNLQVYASVRGVDEDGGKTLTDILIPHSVKDSSVFSVEVAIDDILEKVNDARDEDDLEVVAISYVSLSVGRSSGLKSASAVVSTDQDLIGFQFMNCFGLPEQIWMHGEALDQLAVDVETAEIGHRTVKYDIEQSQSYKVEAINIPDSEWPRVSQFLTSQEIYEVSTGRRIFLSDISQEPCRNYDALGSLKFSYSYEDDRLTL